MPTAAALTIDPSPRFQLSPYLYMQFMEPLGTTDSSIEAGWDFQRGCWREDLVEAARDLRPALIRWPGGCLTSYCRWKEAVGPRSRRRPMVNLCWGGVETNQVGTHEFIDFCRRTGADPLIAVNFESDGRKHWARPLCGGVRSAGPGEAAQWVDYCNNPANKARRENGSPEPFNVRLWQIGNETSYDPNGYDADTTARRTLAFARAMRRADPGISLIAWGDGPGWPTRVLDTCGSEIDYIAFHCHFDPGEFIARGGHREDPAKAWDILVNVHSGPEAKVRQMREEMRGYDSHLAITEGHFTIRARNRGEIMSSWAVGVADARIFHVYERNGDIVKIATLADFCGNRWMVNALMIPTPAGGSRTYLMPVARVMQLYRAHTGSAGLDVIKAPNALDVTASRTADRIFLHVVNTSMTAPCAAAVGLSGLRIASGRVFEIAADPFSEVTEFEPDFLAPREHALPDDGVWTFPPASVSALELDVSPERSP